MVKYLLLSLEAAVGIFISRFLYKNILFRVWLFIFNNFEKRYEIINSSLFIMNVISIV